MSTVSLVDTTNANSTQTFHFATLLFRDASFATLRDDWSCFYYSIGATRCITRFRTKSCQGIKKYNVKFYFDLTR